MTTSDPDFTDTTFTTDVDYEDNSTTDEYTNHTTTSLIPTTTTSIIPTTTTSDLTTTPSDLLEDYKIPIIAGAASGVVLLIVIIVVTVVCCKRRNGCCPRQDQKKKSRHELEHPEDMNKKSSTHTQQGTSKDEDTNQEDPRNSELYQVDPSGLQNDADIAGDSGEAYDEVRFTSESTRLPPRYSNANNQDIPDQSQPSPLLRTLTAQNPGYLTDTEVDAGTSSSRPRPPQKPAMKPKPTKQPKPQWNKSNQLQSDEHKPYDQIWCGQQDDSQVSYGNIGQAVELTSPKPPADRDTQEMYGNIVSADQDEQQPYGNIVQPAAAPEAQEQYQGLEMKDNSQEIYDNVDTDGNPLAAQQRIPGFNVTPIADGLRAHFTPDNRTRVTPDRVAHIKEDNSSTYENIGAVSRKGQVKTLYGDEFTSQEHIVSMEDDLVIYENHEFPETRIKSADSGSEADPTDYVNVQEAVQDRQTPDDQDMELYMNENQVRGYGIPNQACDIRLTPEEEEIY